MNASMLLHETMLQQGERRQNLNPQRYIHVIPHINHTAESGVPRRKLLRGSRKQQVNAARTWQNKSNILCHIQKVENLTNGGIRASSEQAAA